MESFLLAFIPLFVAIDPIGLVPMFLGLTDGYSSEQRRRLAIQAVFTAFFLGIGFALAGHYVFRFLGITPSDFKIAGGLLLLIFSIREIFGETPKLSVGIKYEEYAGVVPLGIPLIAGPAMITTLLILNDMHAPFAVLLALIANLVITLYMFIGSEKIFRRIGDVFGRMMGKVVAIFLAAIGVMMIRKGLEALLTR